MVKILVPTVGLEQICGFLILLPLVSFLFVLCFVGKLVMANDNNDCIGDNTPKQTPTSIDVMPRGS